MMRLELRSPRVYLPLLALFLLLLLPRFITQPFYLDILVRVLLFGLLGVAWNLLGGYAGQLSLGHAAYFGLGGYTSTLLLIKGGRLLPWLVGPEGRISPWIGMLAGAVVAMLASIPLGLICFRLRGPYFAIATIGMAESCRLLFLKFRGFAWGAEGTTIPYEARAPLVMMQFGTKGGYYYLALALLLLAVWVTWRVERSWLGYYLVAIGEDQDAAEAVGVNVPLIKQLVLLMSAGFTAIAGTFYVQYIYFIDPNSVLGLNISVEIALVAIVGGIGTVWGPVLGAALLEPTSSLTQSWLGGTYAGSQLVLYALILMAVILWRPSGLIGFFDALYARLVHALPGPTLATVAALPEQEQAPAGTGGQ